MKTIVSLVSILAIPKYLVRFVLTLFVVLFLVIWVFNISTLVSLLDFGLPETIGNLITGYGNFFIYGIDLTEFLLIMISVMASINLTANRYLRDVNSNPHSSLKFVFLALLLILLNVMFAPVLLTGLGINQVGGSAQLITDILLFISLSLSVYSVKIVGASIEPIINGRDEIERKTN